MTGTGKRPTALLLTLALALVAGLAGYIGARHFLLRTRVAWAQEQIEVFHAMRDRALDAQTKDAVGFLRYAVEYYPSGTKQIPGYALDRVVEQARAEMVRETVADLRKKASTDLGADPQRWIAEYAAE